jgi:hypothetical protein
MESEIVLKTNMSLKTDAIGEVAHLVERLTDVFIQTAAVCVQAGAFDCEEV